MPRLIVGGLGIFALSAAASAQPFVNFETPQVSPLALTPSGGTLLAVNTADNRLEVFDVSGGHPVRVRSIPVGLDPVSVRARTETEAWVVNHISDSVSIVDIPTGRVVQTLNAADGPADVVFAGTPQRAFVSCAKANQVQVFDPDNLGAAPTVVGVAADEPRALAVSPDGSRVYAAIFFSGNASTVLPAGVVSQTGGPYGGQNPPPNLLNAFDPPIANGLPTPPAVALIVKRDPGTGIWADDNIGDWSSFVTWSLADRDVAIIDANTPTNPVTFANGLMNANMAIAVRPGGDVTTVGTDGTNEVRFEEKVNGVFVRVALGSFSPASPNTTRSVGDLNPHLTYSSSAAAPDVREQSIGDPRGIVWSSAGDIGYVTGMGSNNVAVIGPSGDRLGLINVGQGPTGLALREGASRLYVLNRFDASLSEIDTTIATEVARVSFFDPTPASIKVGRPFLYDTHLTSGLGQAACASCHIDAKMDGLAWDLGSPQGTMKTVNQICRQGPNCAPWHPMKGPMVTQTLQGIVGNGAMHWRGDKENVAAFNPAYQNLQGSAQRSAGEMQQLEAFIATIKYPPNPNRNVDNSLRTSLAVSNGTGNAQLGLNLFNTAPLFGPPGPGGLTCVACHTLPTGTDQRIDFPGPPAANQSLKDVQLRGMEEKLGFNRGQPNSIRGFGYNHDGTADTLFNLFGGPPFSFPPGGTGAQQRRDMEAFFLSITNDTHAAVGRQLTLDGSNNAALAAQLDQFEAFANANQVGLVAKSRQNGLQRGYRYNGGGLWQSDRLSQALADSTLRAAASLGAEVTFTVVPSGSQTRIGIDRDLDGFFDRDELDARSNSMDPSSTPQPLCMGNADGNASISFADVTSILANFGANYGELTGPGDSNRDGVVDFSDITATLANFGNPC